MALPIDPNDPSTHVASPPPNMCQCANPSNCPTCLSYMVNLPPGSCACSPAGPCKMHYQAKLSANINSAIISPANGWIYHGATGTGIWNEPTPIVLEDPNAPPKHCNSEAKWVNNGIGFRYFLCSVCKEEVDHHKNDPKFGK